jgi:hypothetical protein
MLRSMRKVWNDRTDSEYGRWSDTDSTKEDSMGSQQWYVHYAKRGIYLDF